MKKILLALAFVATAFTSTAQAHGWGRGAYFTSGVVIGAATYAIATRPYVYGPPAYYSGPYYAGYPYYAPPVVVQQPVYIQQSQPAGYHQETILDNNCNCYRNVLVPN